MTMSCISGIGPRPLNVTVDRGLTRLMSLWSRDDHVSYRNELLVSWHGLVQSFLNTHTLIYTQTYIYMYIYCIKGNVNVCLIFPNLPIGFETGTIKTLSLIICVGMLGQAMFVFRLSNTAVYLSNSLAQQMATYVIWIVAVFMSKSQQTTIHSKTYSFG